MNHKMILSIAGFCTLLMTGCTTYAPRYSTSVENMIYLKDVKGTAKVRLATFSSYRPGLHAIGCRGVGPVSAPDDQPFERYIQRAIEAELRVSDLFDLTDSIEMKGHLEKISMSSNIGVARWEITMSFSSPGKESFTVSIVHKVNSAWNGQQACFLVAQGLVGAVQELLFNTFKHPSFKSWLTKKAA